MNQRLQTRIMVGVFLLVIAGILLFVSLSSPKVYEEQTSYTIEQNNAEIVTETKETTNAATVVNLNTATVNELVQIDGIGEKRAKTIIAYREHIGGYTSVSQITDIEGIGEATYSQLAPYLTV